MVPPSLAANTTSVTAPIDPPPPRPPLVRVWLGLVVLVVVVRLPTLATAAGERAGVQAEALQRVVTEPAFARVARCTSISAALTTAIRDAVPAGGRLVLYSPYGGAEFELDAADPRGEPARQVRTLFERAKNLLYPRPRDVHFARDAAELLGKIDAEFGGAFVVLDGTQGPAQLAVGGDYELLHHEAVGSGQLRLWRLRRQR